MSKSDESAEITEPTEMEITKEASELDSTQLPEDEEREESPELTQDEPPEELEKTEEQIAKENFEESMKAFRELLMKENLKILARMRRYKKTDFRRKIVVNQMKELQKLSELSKAWVSVPYMKRKFNNSTIDVDTSKSGSNIGVVRLAINDCGWNEHPNGKPNSSCHVVWNSVNFKDNPNTKGAFVNKFPGMNQCLHKIAFSRILDTMRQLFPEHYNFYPNTWYLPAQLSDFTIYAKNKLAESNRSKPYYIVKPDAGTQGGGIYLINNPQEYRVSARSHVVQEYLANPLLFEGYKFDLRVYAVVIGLDPPEVYLCEDGLARFCTERYTAPTPANMRAPFMHLTNYSLNKKSSTFDHSQSVDKGSKRTITSVFASLEASGVDVAKIWRGIEEVIYKTVLAIVPHLKVNYVVEMMGLQNSETSTQNKFKKKSDKPECFQILGFDIIIMKNLKIILLEVNSSPSLRMDSEIEIAPNINEYYISKVDVKIKKPLLFDLFKLLEERICDKNNLPKPEKAEDDEDANYEKEKWEDQELSDNDESEKENLHDIRRRWSTESEFGPHFVEIAKRNTNGTNLQSVFRQDNVTTGVESDDEIQKKSSTNNNDKTDSDIQVTVSGTSPQVRQKQVKRQLSKLAKEKSWIKSVTEENEENDEDDGSSSKSDSPKSHSCLQPVSIANYQAIYDKLRILEETTVIFLNAMGGRCSEVMGPTAFRTFSRNCKLYQLGFNHAMVDLIYVEIHRRWSFLNNQDNSQGLCYQAFLEAFFRIALAKYNDVPKRTAVNNLIEHSKKAMGTDLWDWKSCMYPKLEKHTRIVYARYDPSRVYGASQKFANSPYKLNSNSQAQQQQQKDQMKQQQNYQALQLKSRYEFMKAIRKLYNSKWRSLTTKPNTSSTNRDSGSNSDDNDSIKSLPPLNTNSSTSGSNNGLSSKTDQKITGAANGKSYTYNLPDKRKKNTKELSPYDMAGVDNYWNKYPVLPNPNGKQSNRPAGNNNQRTPSKNPYKTLMKDYDVEMILKNERMKAMNGTGGGFSPKNEEKIKQLASIYGNSNNSKLLQRRSLQMKPGGGLIRN